MKFKQPVLILHGGAGNLIKDTARATQMQKRLIKYTEETYSKLKYGNALDAVVNAVALLENDPLFNAGLGSYLQADGRARLSASVMDSKNQTFAAVINLQNIRNPILVAKALLKSESKVLSGKGALKFALSIGMKQCETRTRESLMRYQNAKLRGYDTVGACALDRLGRLACATSTGGRGLEFPDRVSDAGMPIANFATSHCAISSSGIGEHIISEGLAVRIAQKIQDGCSLKQTFKKIFSEVQLRKRKMGAIGISKNGMIAFSSTTSSFLVAYQKGKIQRSFF